MNSQEVRLPGPLDLSGNEAENWRRYLEDFDIYLVRSEKEGKKDNVKIALLLNCGGRGLVDIFNTLSFEDPEDKTKYKDVLAKLSVYFEPKQYITYERYRFFTRVQKVDESIDDYITDLKIKARNCNFGDLKDEMMRDKIICGITSEQLRGRLLRQGDISLDKVLEVCRSHEASERQLKDLNSVTKSSDMNVNVVNSKSDYKKVSHGLDECKFCGYKHVFGKSNCPAVNKNCASCGAQGHFKKKCSNKGNGTKQKSRQVRYAQHRPVSEDENDTSDEEHERLVGHLQVMKIKKPGDICSIKNEHKCVSDNMISLELPRDLPVKLQTDTGTEASVLPKYVFDKLKVKPEVQPT